MKYQKKPVAIEAVQWKGGEASYHDVSRFMGMQPILVGAPLRQDEVIILEGDYLVSIGDWIIRDIEGEIYPIKNDIFWLTYEPVE